MPLKIQWPVVFQKKTSREEAIFRNDIGMRHLLQSIGIGALIILAIGLINYKNFFPILGLSHIVALASIFAGGFLGFIFGIPKVLQASGSNNSATANSQSVTGNTNLEQISDWLTKIIVGVSLTQLPQIGKGFSDLARNIAAGFVAYIPNQAFAFAYACALIIFYSIAGFLLLYLWARIYLLRQMQELDKHVQGVVSKVMDIKAEIEVLKKDQAQLKKEQTYVQNLEANYKDPDAVAAIKTAAPALPSVVRDAQKDRWGGKASTDKYQVEATGKTASNSSDSFDITVTVSAINPSVAPLTGKVFFILHPAFSADKYIQCVMADNNQAILQFQSAEAFTVGIVCLGGTVKMEIDLNNCDVPESYKYTDTLLTGAQISQQIDNLELELKNLTEQ